MKKLLFILFLLLNCTIYTIRSPHYHVGQKVSIVYYEGKEFEIVDIVCFSNSVDYYVKFLKDGSNSEYKYFFVKENDIIKLENKTDRRK